MEETQHDQGENFKQLLKSHVIGFDAILNRIILVKKCSLLICTQVNQLDWVKLFPVAGIGESSHRRIMERCMSIHQKRQRPWTGGKALTGRNRRPQSPLPLSRLHKSSTPKIILPLIVVWFPFNPVVNSQNQFCPVDKLRFQNSRPGENESKYCPQYLQNLCSDVGIHSEAASIVLRRYRARYPAQRL